MQNIIKVERRIIPLRANLKPRGEMKKLFNMRNLGMESFEIHNGVVLPKWNFDACVASVLARSVMLDAVHRHEDESGGPMKIPFNFFMNAIVGATNTAENGFLLLIFNNTNFANIGDATGLRGSTTAGSLYVSLHTADPDETGSQTTSETAYTNYVRVGVARSGAGWTVSGTAPTQAVNAAAVNFAECGVTGATLTHAGIGTDSSAAGTLLFAGALGASRTISTGTAPQFQASGDLKVTLD